jgi:hypothetical protein
MRRRNWLIGALVVTLAAFVVLAGGGDAVRDAVFRAECFRQFQSDYPDDRKQAAWSVIEHPDAKLEAFMVRGMLGDEPSADVRESYVYSLGKLHDPGVFPAIETLLNIETDGYVRAAAWLAAARSDPVRFEHLVNDRAVSGDAWEQVGVAQGWLALGDVRGVDELLRLARSDNEQLRYVASRALYRWVRPLLDTTGRWPVDAGVGESDIWSPALVERIARRCGEVDLAAVAAAALRSEAAAARVRRNQTRITNAREDLVGLLFDKQRKQAHGE